MAGATFKLEKILNNKNQYLIFTTLGPSLISSVLLCIIKLILFLTNAPYSDTKLVMASIIYIFIFSYLITSGFSMFISRYVSDLLYTNDFKNIMPSFYGITLLSLSIGSIFYIIFFFNSSLSLFIKFITYILYIQFIILWIQITFLTILTNYIQIFKNTFIGFISILISSLLLINYTEFSFVICLLVGVNIGIFITMSLLMNYLNNFFEIKNSDRTHSTLSNNLFEKYFNFLNCLNEFASLFFINFFYTLSLYVHIFMFWCSDLNQMISNTYNLATKYDIPAFFAFITSVPAMVLFIITIETTFYKKNKNSNVVSKSILSNIESSKKDIPHRICIKLGNIMNLQITISFILLLLGHVFLPMIGFTNDMLAIWGLLTLGAYCSIFILIFILIHLYFDNKKNPLIISLSFLITNVLFTRISIWAGPEYYGLGYLASALISLIIAGLMLKSHLKKQF